MNEYEAKRDARIARNRAILAQLVGDLPHALMTAPTGTSPRASRKAGSGKKRPRATIDEEDLRRSGRIRNLPAPIYTTFERDDDLGDQNASRSRPRGVHGQTTANDARAAKDRYAGTSAAGGIVTTTSTPRSSKPAAPVSANSLRSLDAKMSQCAANHLGRPISDGTGAFKAAVVHEISPITNPKFSKMSGIQEWRNVVTLFVNVGDKHGDSYENVFTHCGGRITWFAQPRQGEDTPVIQRIARTNDGKGMDALALATAPAGLIPGDEDDDEEGEEGNDGAKTGAKTGPDTGAETEAGRGKGRQRRDKEWPVHLFCRMEGCEYVYCGRLRTIEHDPTVRPMKFTFRLLDAPLLRTSDDFLGLVDLADADADPGLGGGAAKKAPR